ncbi:MAG: hypothetical protein ABIV47_11660 [Roseiflexaceae bacterium]
MRQRALQAAMLAMLALTLLCSVGLLRVWSGQGWNLVMRGAGNVQIERRGAMRLQITYQLPAKQTRHDLRAFLVRQGWRRSGLSNIDRETVMTFVRPGWRGRSREVLVVTTDRSHRIVDMQFGHCVTIGTWATCI